MKTLEQRFWEKVDKTEECWNWTAATRNSGYGCIKVNGKVQDSHRLSWSLVNGDIQNGLFVLHRCDNRLCVRPDHLFLGTQKDNMRDATSKGRMSVPHDDTLSRRTHCNYGHEFTPENTGTSKGYRRCKECNKNWMRNYRG